VAYEMAASVFEDEAVRALGHGDRDAVATPEFIARKAGGGRSGYAHATTHFIASWAMGGRNHTAVSTVEHIAGWAFGTVLVEAGAAAPVFAVAAMG
jgi:hypothetical protein